jgi:hypothetical protein
MRVANRRSIRALSVPGMFHRKARGRDLVNGYRVTGNRIGHRPRSPPRQGADASDPYLGFQETSSRTALFLRHPGLAQASEIRGFV